MSRILPFFCCLIGIGACSDEPPAEPTVPGRWYTQSQVDAGHPLYASYCASCHAADGSATPDWRKLDADGNYPPPPLNGTAHTWHHPLAMLDGTIRDGGAQFGGLMPGFGAVLDRDQRLAVIAWCQSLWPDDIYAKWAEIDARSR